MVEYSKVRVNLSDTQLKKLKTAVKNKTKKTKRMRLKMLHGNDLLHELLLSTRQRTKLRNTFNNNMSTDLKLSKVPLAKKYFSFIRNYSSCFSNWWSNSKENTWFWSPFVLNLRPLSFVINFNKFEQRN